MDDDRTVRRRSDWCRFGSAAIAAMAVMQEPVPEDRGLGTPCVPDTKSCFSPLPRVRMPLRRRPAVVLGGPKRGSVSRLREMEPDTYGLSHKITRGTGFRRFDLWDEVLALGASRIA
jgi:hypothetical protein